jgi:hypothetical protein
VKFVPRDPGESSENSSGGGLDGFLQEAALMLAAHWVLGLLIPLALGVLVGLFFLVTG